MELCEKQKKKQQAKLEKVKTAVRVMRIKRATESSGKKLTRVIDTCLILLKEGSRVHFFFLLK